MKYLNAKNELCEYRSNLLKRWLYENGYLHILMNINDKLELICKNKNKINDLLRGRWHCNNLMNDSDFSYWYYHGRSEGKSEYETESFYLGVGIIKIDKLIAEEQIEIKKIEEDVYKSNFSDVDDLQNLLYRKKKVNKFLGLKQRIIDYSDELNNTNKNIYKELAEKLTEIEEKYNIPESYFETEKENN